MGLVGLTCHFKFHLGIMNKIILARFKKQYYKALIFDILGEL